MMVLMPGCPCCPTGSCTRCQTWCHLVVTNTKPGAAGTIPADPGNQNMGLVAGPSTCTADSQKYVYFDPWPKVDAPPAAFTSRRVDQNTYKASSTLGVLASGSIGVEMPYANWSGKAAILSAEGIPVSQFASTWLKYVKWGASWEFLCGTNASGGKEVQFRALSWVNANIRNGDLLDPNAPGWEYHSSWTLDGVPLKVVKLKYDQGKEITPKTLFTNCKQNSPSVCAQADDAKAATHNLEGVTVTITKDAATVTLADGTKMDFPWDTDAITNDQRSVYKMENVVDHPVDVTLGTGDLALETDMAGRPLANGDHFLDISTDHLFPVEWTITSGLTGAALAPIEIQWANLAASPTQYPTPIVQGDPNYPPGVGNLGPVFGWARRMDGPKITLCNQKWTGEILLVVSGLVDTAAFPYTSLCDGVKRWVFRVWTIYKGNSTINNAAQYSRRAYTFEQKTPGAAFTITNTLNSIAGTISSSPCLAPNVHPENNTTPVVVTV